MIDKHLHNFYLSYRLDGEVGLEWVEGINLRHAKDKIQFKYPEASDLMDWTNEKKEDLEAYLEKVRKSKEQKSQKAKESNNQ